MAYRILIADDQKMVRQMFSLALERKADYEIAGMASTPEEAVKICLEKLPDEYRVDDDHLAACWLNVADLMTG